MANDTTPLLDDAGKETWDVFEGQERDVERITRANEAGGLDGRVNVQAPCQHLGLIADHTHRGAVHSSETNDDVIGIGRKQFHEHAIIDHLFHHFHHVVGLVGVVRYDVLQGFVESGDGVPGGQHRWVCHVVVGQVGQQRGGQFARILFVVCNERRNARTGGMKVGASKTGGVHLAADDLGRLER